MLFEGNFTKEEILNDNLINKIDKTCFIHNHIDYFKTNGCKIIRNYTIPKFGNNIMLFEKQIERKS